MIAPRTFVRPILCAVVCFGLSMTMPVSSSLAQDAKKPSDFVDAQQGELPIILSAPHGGELAIPEVPVRKGEGLEKGSKGFFTGRDFNTELIGAALAAEIEKIYGKKPYFVFAKFHRKYIDANRPPQIAYENSNAKPVYEEYHGKLNDYCKEVQKTFGRGLLLDLHGQGYKADTIFRGTQNGKTVKLLTQRFGEKAHNGPNSFFGLLAANGCKAHPLDGGPEQSGYTGGFIVQNYGSHQGYGIDAIQLEFGGDYRKKEAIRDTAAKVAKTIEGYGKLYLFEPAKESPGR